jgi:hypothetical protein
MQLTITFPDNCDRVEITKERNNIEMRVELEGATFARHWLLKPWEDERDVDMKIVKPENSPFSFKAVVDKAIHTHKEPTIEERLDKLESVRRSHFNDHGRLEDRLVKLEKAREGYTPSLVLFSAHTQRLWSIVKQAMGDEKPEYITKHGESDEAILFLVLSRYIEHFIGSVDKETGFFIHKED